MKRGCLIGVVAAVGWIAAGLALFGGNMDTFLWVILFFFSSPVVGLGTAALASRILKSSMAYGWALVILLTVAPGGVAMGVKWVLSAPARAKQKELNAEGQAQGERFKAAGWVEPPVLQRRGAREGLAGVNEDVYYSAPDMVAAVTAIDRHLGSDWDRFDAGDSVHWAKKAATATVWITAREGSYGGDCRVRFTSDKGMLDDIAKELAEELNLKRGPFPKISKWAGRSIDVLALRRELGIVDTGGVVLQNFKLDGGAASVEIQMGREKIDDYRTKRFARLRFARDRAMWRVSGLEAVP